MKYVYSLPAPGKIEVRGRAREYLDFVAKSQLYDPSLWQRFVSAFTKKADTADRGWRGEYWGKMMRGATLTYRCTNDGVLYEVLRNTVLDMLSAAEPDGRISSYDLEHEFSGWDMWCRKYVLTGMLHFCDVCDDDVLVNRILDAMERHLDCIIRAVGSATGQIEITSTSDYWLGVNSCSILEPVMDLYKRRPQKRFLSFAEYIIGTGGCSGGDLISLALQNEKAPYQYPETKAYETMSFFEGVLAYAEVTDSEKYFNAVVRFAEKVYETDITLIGCAGCTHELFDNSAVRQTEYSDLIMQETCVTVTWMRLCARLYLLTGDSKYADRIECSALNALFGSVNIYKQPFTIVSSGYKLPWLPFDSYSPLFMNRRGREVGGCKFFDDGSFYGCCVAIGIAGLAVYSLIDSLKKPEESLYVLNEHRLNGKIAFTYGPYVLARDKAKEKKDINVSVRPRYDNGVLCCKHLPCMSGESVRLLLETEDGNVLLTDYASCGKHWAEEDGIISVWLPT